MNDQSLTKAAVGEAAAALEAPRVSVALATFNGAQHLEAQLRSIEAQTYPNLEIVVSDDGSSDQTLDLLSRRAWARPHIVLRGEPRVGIVGNFQRALAACDGRYVALADQDDCWHREKIAALVAAVKEIERAAAGPALAFSDISVVDASLAPLRASFFSMNRKSPRAHRLADLLLANHVPGCAMLVNRALLDRALPIPENFHMHDWWLMMTAATSGRIAFVDRALHLYRQHEANAIGATARRSRWTDKLRKIGSIDAWARYLLPSRERVELVSQNVRLVEERLGPSFNSQAMEDLALFRRALESSFGAWRFTRRARTGESLFYSLALLHALGRHDRVIR